MQPSFQQSAASAHIEHLVHAAQSYRLADRRRGGAVARVFEVVRAAFAPRPRVRRAQHV